MKKLLGFAIVAGVMLGSFGQMSAQATLLTFQPKTVGAGGTGNYHDSFIASYGGAGSGASNGDITAYIGSFQGRYLVQFDELNPWINSGSKVTSATLTLMYYGNSFNNDLITPDISVFRVTNSWENGATWTGRGGSLGSWTATGGDYDPTPVASLSLPTAPAPFTYLSWDVTSLVSDWVDGVNPHYGMLLKWDPQVGFDRWWQFGGPGGPTISGLDAPFLTLDVVTPEPSVTLLLLTGGGLLLARTRRTRPARV